MAGAIDEYVGAVGRGLRGSARLRADMLAEIRDGLVDAAEFHRADGVGDAEAQRLAVAEFGSARRVAADLQDVLAVVHGRRTAWLLLGVLGTQHAVAEYVGRSGGWRQWWGDAEPSAAYLWLARATDVFVVFALAAATAAVVALGWALRYLGFRREIVRLTAVLTAVVVATTLVSAVLLTVLTPSGGGDMLPAALFGALWLTVPFAFVLDSARRCWRAAAG